MDEQRDERRRWKSPFEKKSPIEQLADEAAEAEEDLLLRLEREVPNSPLGRRFKRLALSHSLTADEQQELTELEAVLLPSQSQPTPGRIDKPLWNAERRELSLDGRVVKQFRQKPGNQDKILASFEEEEWPQRIHDPLPPGKLADTLKAMSKWAPSAGLVFERDGTGEAILWRQETELP